MTSRSPTSSSSSARSWVLVARCRQVPRGGGRLRRRRGQRGDPAAGAGDRGQQRRGGRGVCAAAGAGGVRGGDPGGGLLRERGVSAAGAGRAVSGEGRAGAHGAQDRAPQQLRGADAVHLIHHPLPLEQADRLVSV